MEVSRLELAENRLILGHFYSTLLYAPSLPPSIQEIHQRLVGISQKISLRNSLKVVVI